MPPRSSPPYAAGMHQRRTPACRIASQESSGQTASASAAFASAVRRACVWGGSMGGAFMGSLLVRRGQGAELDGQRYRLAGPLHLDFHRVTRLVQLQDPAHVRERGDLAARELNEHVAGLEPALVR